MAPPATTAPQAHPGDAPFPTFFGGGFECSTHRRGDGQRLDLLAATAHDRWAADDYYTLARQGLGWARDGLRWHRIERAVGRYDFASFLPRLRAARDTGVTAVWDLCHYGYPDDLDVWTPAFVERFARFARAAAEVVRAETDAVPLWCPVNEISYWSWAGGDVAHFNPHAHGRGFELKVQLARAALAAADAVRAVDPRARLLWAEPVIHVAPHPDRPEDAADAEGHRQAQFQAWDLIAGRIWPQIGGSEDVLDLVGVNYYDHNQWVHGGPHLAESDALYRPFRDILSEVAARYDRPLVVAETGTEGEARVPWLRMICREVAAARGDGAPVEGVCWYPVIDYPGWDDDRRCTAGLLGYADAAGNRPLFAPLAAELHRQQAHFQAPRSEREATSDPVGARGMRDARPAVCLYTESPEPSGVGTHMLALAARLRERYRLSFVCPPTGGGTALLGQAADLDLAILALDEPGVLEPFLACHPAGLVHVHAGIGWEGHEGARLARAAGARVLRTEHLPYLLTDPAQQASYCDGLGDVDRVLCVSDGVRQSFEAAGVAPERLVVVRNGIAEPTAVAEAEPGFRASLDLPVDSRLVLTVGRFTHQKGYDVLLNAVPAVLDHVPGARFLWVGDGGLQGELTAEVERRGLAGAVRLLGRRADVPALMAAADVLVLPSRFEGLPLVVLEAFASGLPVVATRVVGTEEAVCDSETGWLVVPEDPAALTAAVLEALCDTAEAARRARAARADFDARWTADRMAADTARLYDELLTPSLTPDFMTRIGFIGGGGIARRHLHVLRDFDDVELVAVADPACADETAADFGLTSYPEHEAMLGAEGLDAVCICIPPFAHGSAERACLERGLPFFAEKPLALDLGAAEEIGRAVEAAGLVTAVGYHWRYMSHVALARERLEETPARLALGYWLGDTPPPAWWHRQDGSGGQMVEQTTHLFDLARYLVGEARTVCAAGGRSARAAFPDLDVHDATAALVTFESGAVGTFASTCLLGWTHRVGLHLFGPALAVEIGEHDLVVDIGEGRPVTPAEADPVVLEDRDFVDAVQGKPNRIRVPYAEALKTHRLVLAAQRAVETGEVVEIEAAHV